MTLTLNPTTRSPECSEVDFLTGGQGSRGGLAESPLQAVLQEGILKWAFPVMVCLVLSFWQAGSVSIWFYPSWHRWLVWIKDHIQSQVHSQLLGSISHESRLARKPRDDGPSAWTMGSALIFSSAYLSGGHVVASFPPIATPSLGLLGENAMWGSGSD